MNTTWSFRPHSTSNCCTSACDNGKRENRKQEESKPVSPPKAFVPHVDIVESDDRITLVADLPGVDEGSLAVNIEKNVLSLRGQVKQAIPEGYVVVSSEYEVGDFERSFTISNDIDRANIDAVVKDGVLRLTLPKSHHAMVQKIPVKTAP